MNQNEYNKLQDRIEELEEKKDIYKCAFNLLFMDTAKGKFGCKIDGVGLHDVLYLKKAKEVIRDKIPCKNSNEYNVPFEEYEIFLNQINKMRYTIANQQNDYMALSYELHELEKENKSLKSECEYYRLLFKKIRDDIKDNDIKN